MTPSGTGSGAGVVLFDLRVAEDPVEIERDGALQVPDRLFVAVRPGFPVEPWAES